MTEPLDSNWQPLGSIMTRLAAKLEDKHRRQFERECAEDGVGRRVPPQTTGREIAHASDA